MLAAIAIALVIYFSKGCNATETANTTTGAVSGGDGASGDTLAATTPSSSHNGSSDIDFNSPNANYEEITDRDISVRGTDNYAIYSLGENVLFDVDKNTIRQDAEPRLKQIASSLKKRFPTADIRIYGRTDSTGDAAHNKELAEKRAESVKQWITKNAGIGEDKISLFPLGESRPLASNATETGKQQNRSVEIVAKNP